MSGYVNGGCCYTSISTPLLVIVDANCGPKPGSYVSFKGREIDHKDTDVTLCNKIGVVQAADAHERIASGECFRLPACKC